MFGHRQSCKRCGKPDSTLYDTYTSGLVCYNCLDSVERKSSPPIHQQ
jgi:hypothetical protein